MYKLQQTLPGHTGPVGVIRLADGAFIPPDEGNRDWREYLAWYAARATNRPQAADPLPDPPPPERDLAAELDAIKTRVDEVERTRP